MLHEIFFIQNEYLCKNIQKFKPLTKQLTV